jgi:hypothetical protein
VLTTVLSEFEERHGFNLVMDGTTGRKRAKLYLSFVEPTVFLNQLKAGYHWKDPTVSPEHGEFTHRLQWYLLIEGGALNGVSPVDVFKACGNYERKNPPSRSRDRHIDRTDLWELLFDRDTKENPNTFLYPVAASDADFRNPNNLNSYLRGAGNKTEQYRLPNPKLYCKHLHEFLVRRYNKRKEAADIVDEEQQYFFKEYFRGRKVNSLSSDELILYYKYGMNYTVGAIAGLLDVDEVYVQQCLDRSPPIL